MRAYNHPFHQIQSLACRPANALKSGRNWRAAMKVTVSAIAQSCGLSTATVDRALNNRPGISAANRQRVMEAAQRLGYLPTAGAVTLPSRPAALEFFLPIRQNVFMGEVAEHIRAYASRMPLVASCRIHDLPDISPAALQTAVDRLSLD